MSKITLRDLHPSLVRLIGQGGGVGGGFSHEKKSVIVNTDTNEVLIGIPDFDKKTDCLMVFKNSTYIEQGIDYDISADSKKIVSKNGNWNGLKYEGISFNFIVFKSISNDIGSMIYAALSSNIHILENEWILNESTNLYEYTATYNTSTLTPLVIAYDNMSRSMSIAVEIVDNTSIIIRSTIASECDITIIDGSLEILDNYIDDTQNTLSNTWSAKKISDELNANKTDIGLVQNELSSSMNTSISTVTGFKEIDNCNPGMMTNIQIPGKTQLLDNDGNVCNPGINATLYSVGQYGMELFSIKKSEYLFNQNGKIFIDGQYIESSATSANFGNIANNATMCYIDEYIEVEPNQEYIFINANANIPEFDSNQNMIKLYNRYYLRNERTVLPYDGIVYLRTSKDTRYIKVQMRMYNKDKFNYFKASYDIKKILSTLRSTPSGVRDDIYMVGNKYYKLKRCGEFNINTTRDIKASEINPNLTNMQCFYVYLDNDNIAIPATDNVVFNGYCDKFKCISNDKTCVTTTINNSNERGIAINQTSGKSPEFRIVIPKSELSSNDVAGFKKYIQNNSITIVYELSTPVFEEIPNIDSTIFEGNNLIIINSGYVQGDINFEISNTLRNEVDILKEQVAYLSNIVGSVLGYKVEGSDNQNIVLRDITDKKGIQSAIVFEDKGLTKGVQVRYNSFDSEKAPYGIKIERSKNNNQDYKAYLEVEGEIYTNNIPVSSLLNLDASIYTDVIVEGNANTYYPVSINVGNSGYNMCKLGISRGFAWQAPDSWNTPTHKGGLTLDLLLTGDSEWGGNYKGIKVLAFDETYTTMVAGMHLVKGTPKFLVYLRGGGAKYRINSSTGRAIDVNIYYTDVTDGNNSVYKPKTSIDPNTINSQIYNKVINVPVISTSNPSGGKPGEIWLKYQ
ncbi:MAG: hypothetical protein ACRCXT_16650 [Paraclostridium sp.]